MEIEERSKNTKYFSMNIGYVTGFDEKGKKSATSGGVATIASGSLLLCCM